MRAEVGLDGFLGGLVRDERFGVRVGLGAGEALGADGEVEDDMLGPREDEGAERGLDKFRSRVLQPSRGRIDELKTVSGVRRRRRRRVRGSDDSLDDDALH